MNTKVSNLNVRFKDYTNTLLNNDLNYINL